MDSLVTAKSAVGAVVQARAMSRRLPEKIFLKLPFGGPHSLVEQIVLRARKAPSLKSVIVATGVDAANDPLVDAAKRVGAPLFRGSETDVLGRLIGAAEEHGLDVVVRLTGDNPCIDPLYIEQTVQSHLQSGADYTRTVGLPLGTNVEVVSLHALQQIHGSNTTPEDREHVTLYMSRHQSRFTISSLDFSADEYRDLRLTVDWPGDYAFACFLYERLYHSNPSFDLPSIVRVLGDHPWAKFINGSLKQVALRSTIEEELQEAISMLDLHGHTQAGEYLLAILKSRLEEQS